ncbi:GTPase IMAP family member 8-like [Triplophysa rosa]|uniref:GTPase IMAP family member 8-like n=1 Tax=Triplophysa rosa TaxID=992332 RepID=UPI00254619B6|nr:GTPase IMAP family member 8-like [Triplophysa rosa]
MEGAEENTSSDLHYKVILLGRTGAGKSATGNTILGRKAFVSKKSFRTVTQEVQSDSVTIDGVKLTIYDTPGFFDPETERSPAVMFRREGFPELDSTEPLVILLVITTDRFTAEEKDTVESIEDFLPDWLIKNTWIIFTRGDELERDGDTIETLIDESQDLKAVVQRFENRYFVFNNVAQGPNHPDVKRLMDVIRTVQPLAPETKPFLQRQIPAEHERHSSERRLILLGRTGAGKSATGNTLLGDKVFKSEHSFSSVTQHCDIHKAVVSQKQVSVVDTPGFLDLTSRPEDLAEEMGKSVWLCSAGPHAFLYVVSATQRMSTEDENDIKNIKSIYGEEEVKYTIPVFTHCDQLDGRSVEDLLQQNEVLSRFVQRCGGRYHTMNNKDIRNRRQVTRLLHKIDEMLEENGGGHYTNEMFQHAQKCGQDENDDDEDISGNDEKMQCAQNESSPSHDEASETVQGTKESWLGRVWRRVRGSFRKFMNRFRRHFDAVAQFLYSLAQRIIDFVTNLSRTSETKQDRSSSGQRCQSKHLALNPIAKK